MSSYDIDGTGKIEYSDFVDISAWSAHSRLLVVTFTATCDAPHTVTEKYAARDPEEEIRKAFALFDEEGNGKITLKVCGRRRPGWDVRGPPHLFPPPSRLAEHAAHRP